MTSPIWASHWKKAWNATPLNRKLAIGSAAAISPTPEMIVRSENSTDSASVRPRRMNRKASVTMNDGSRVLITRYPLSAPSAIEPANAKRIASEIGQCQ